MGQKVEIHDLPLTPSLNQWQRMHWARRRNFKRRYHLQILGEHRPGTRPWAQWPPEALRRVTVTRRSSKRLDYDNLVGGCKPLVDALVQAGVLLDDSPDHVRVEYIQAKAKPGYSNVSVEVEIDG